MGRIRVRRVRSEGGLAAVELAVVFPVVLLLITVTLHVAMLYLASHVAGDMATTAAETAVRRGATATDGENDALAVAAQEGFVVDPTVTVTRTARVVQVRVTVNSHRLVPGLPTRITRTITAPVEAFIPENQR